MFSYFLSAGQRSKVVALVDDNDQYVRDRLEIMLSCITVIASNYCELGM